MGLFFLVLLTVWLRFLHWKKVNFSVLFKLRNVFFCMYSVLFILSDDYSHVLSKNKCFIDYLQAKVFYWLGAKARNCLVHWSLCYALMIDNVLGRLYRFLKLLFNKTFCPYMSTWTWKISMSKCISILDIQHRFILNGRCNLCVSTDYRLLSPSFNPYLERAFLFRYGNLLLNHGTFAWAGLCL